MTVADGQLDRADPGAGWHRQWRDLCVARAIARAGVRGDAGDLHSARRVRGVWRADLCDAGGRRHAAQFVAVGGAWHRCRAGWVLACTPYVGWARAAVAAGGDAAAAGCGDRRDAADRAASAGRGGAGAAEPGDRYADGALRVPYRL